MAEGCSSEKGAAVPETESPSFLTEDAAELRQSRHLVSSLLSNSLSSLIPPASPRSPSSSRTEIDHDKAFGLKRAESTPQDHSNQDETELEDEYSKLEKEMESLSEQVDRFLKVSQRCSQVVSSEFSPWLLDQSQARQGGVRGVQSRGEWEKEMDSLLARVKAMRGGVEKRLEMQERMEKAHECTELELGLTALSLCNQQFLNCA